MSAANLNLIIEKNADFGRRMVWRDRTYTPVNLTGYTGKLQVRSTETDPTVLLEISTVNSRLILGGKSGLIEYAVPVAALSALSWLTAVYDLVLTAPSGKKYRLLYGTATLVSGTTL